MALSDRAGIAALIFQKGNSGIGSIAGENPIAAQGGAPDHVRLDVATVRLDEEGLDPVGLIKIDVEGHEAAVLAGALGLIARDHPRLLQRDPPGTPGYVNNFLFLYKDDRIA